ncbi:MAG: MMPL family transporter [Candidatus Sericytochromatia bacterium]|nr:MMPL family transporter [Candidatus Sericytochromatia bacterium]
MKPHGMLATFAEAAVRRPWRTLATWAFCVIVAGILTAIVPSHLHGGVDSIPGTPSWRVEHALATEFDSPFAQFVVVAVRPLGRDNAPAQAAAADLVRVLAREPDVRRADHWPGQPEDPPAIIVGLATPDLDSSERAVPRLRAAIARAMTHHPGAEALVTGHAPLNADLGTSGAAASAEGERRVLPLTLLALALAFGAPLAALVPLIAGIASVMIASGVLALLALVMSLAAFSGNVAAMLGLGLGIDYALLVVWRVREETALSPDDRQGAVRRAVRATAPVIGVSALAVGIGLLGLACVPAQDTRSMGLGGVVVTAIAALAGMTLLPALVALMGPWLDAPRALSRRSGGDAGIRRWQGWAGRVVARPWPALLLAIGVLMTLAAPIRDLHFGLPELSVVPSGLESMRGHRVLERRGDGGIWIPILVMIRFPVGESVLAPGHLASVATVAEMLRADPRLGDVRTVTGSPTETPWAITMAAMLGPEGFRARLPEAGRWQVSRDGRATVIYATPRQGLSFAALKTLNAELQQRDWHQTPGLAAATVEIGGAGAVELDRQHVTLQAFPWVAAGIVVATLVALFALSGSILIPLKAVLANGLTVAGALGATVSLLQHPVSAHLIGLAGPVTAIPPAIPIMVFCIVFGLTMDYEVFLIARVLDAHRHGAPDGEAIITGIGATGGVITWAAVIMGLVFGGFALADQVLLKMMGLALAVGVLLDATIVRMLLVPAMMAIAGRWNWWPDRAWFDRAPKPVSRQALRLGEKGDQQDDFDEQQ